MSELLAQDVPSKGLVAVWSHDPNEFGHLPDLLICEDGSEEDWAAWITTFAPRVRPFSAYMRLVPQKGAENLMHHGRIPQLNGLLWPLAGLVLGEVLAASGLPDRALETLPAAAFTSTLSFVLFRAAAAYSRFDDWEKLVSTWELVRQATKQRARLLDGADVARACATVLDASGTRGVGEILGPGSRDARIACQELLSSPGRAPMSFWRNDLFGVAEGRMRGSREDRVVAFEEFARNLDGHSAPEPEIVPLMLGYLASRIAPGTLRHSTVLSPVARRYPTAQLWYGFCAGFGDIDDVEASIDERREALDLPASARRVARDLLRAEPSLAAPSCDIGFLELLALSPTGEDALDGLITTTPGTATVELAPYIWTTLTVPGRGKAEAPAQRSRERANLVMLGESLERATRAYSNLVSGVFAPEEDRQRPLFPTPRKTR